LEQVSSVVFEFLIGRSDEVHSQEQQIQQIFDQIPPAVTQHHMQFTPNDALRCSHSVSCSSAYRVLADFARLFQDDPYDRRYVEGFGYGEPTYNRR
jgi:hypothetical protein